MRTIATITIFITALAITANTPIYVQSLRLFIYAWHIFLPIIPIHLAIALALGTIFKVDRVTVMYYLWASLFLLVLAASILTKGGAANMSDATRYVTTFGIGLSFIAAAQHRSLAIAGALGIAAATAIAASISFAEFLNPDYTAIVDQRYEHDKIREGIVSRVGGLHINPNSNARFMALGMFVSCFFLPKRFRLGFCLFVGVAVFTTVSRSGMMTWALAMMMLTFLGQFSSGKIFSQLFAIVGIGTLGLLLSSGQIPVILESLGLDDLMSKSMTDRISTGFFSQASDSADTRLDLVPLALEMFSENPILGAGVGQSSNLGDTGLGPHNTLLEIAAEFGTVGLLVYISLLLIPLSLRSPKSTCFFLLFTFSGMFAHGILVKAVIGFILPTGIVLLARLDLEQRASESVVKPRRRRRKRRRSSQNAVARPS